MEDLDDPHAGKMLGEEGVQRGDAGLDDLIALAAEPAENEGQHSHHRHHHQGQQRHFHIQHQHHGDQADHLDDVAEQTDDDVGVQIVDGLGVVGDAGDDAAHGGGVEEAHRQALHMGHQLGAQGVDDLLAHLLDHQVLHAVAYKGHQHDADVERGGFEDAVPALIGGEGRQRGVCRFAFNRENILVNSVADEHGPVQVQRGEDGHQHKADQHRFDIGAEVAHQAQEGVTVVLDVIGLLVLQAADEFRHYSAPPS